MFETSVSRGTSGGEDIHSFLFSWALFFPVGLQAELRGRLARGGDGELQEGPLVT